LRELADKVQRMDDDQLIIEYKSVSPFSVDDEFIQLLLKEIVRRKINIDTVLKQLHLL
jgi:Sporulation inhibitor A.